MLLIFPEYRWVNESFSATNFWVKSLSSLKSLKHRYINLSPKEKYRGKAGKILCIVLIGQYEIYSIISTSIQVYWLMLYCLKQKNNKVYSIYRGLICLIYIICRYLFTLFDNNSWSMFKVPVMIRGSRNVRPVKYWIVVIGFKISSIVTWKRPFLV